MGKKLLGTIFYLLIIVLIGFSCRQSEKDFTNRHYQDTFIQIKEENEKNTNSQYIYGYKLLRNGACGNPNQIKKLFTLDKELDSLTAKQNHSHLTVYNNNKVEIKSFLNSTDSQIKLFNELKPLMKLNYISGVNFYFKQISREDSNEFVLFLERFRNNIRALDSSIQLTVSIPFIGDGNSLKRVIAYDFLRLNPIVDSYLLFTEELVDLNETSSPINEEITSLDKLENTINFYSNGRIPVSKLIVLILKQEQDLKDKYLWVKESKLGGISILKFI